MSSTRVQKCLIQGTLVITALFQKPNEEKTKNSQTFIVNAFAWDGKNYKAVGKVGLALIFKDKKPLMILYKSKQQTLSTLDLAQEHIKLEQQSENVIGTLDQQVWILRLGYVGGYLVRLSELDTRESSSQ